MPFHHDLQITILIDVKHFLNLIIDFCLVQNLETNYFFNLRLSLSMLLSFSDQKLATKLMEKRLNDDAIIIHFIMENWRLI